MQDLRFGLELELAQLLLEARHRARQLADVEIDRADLLLEAGARDAGFAGIVEQLVEQLGVDAREFRPVGWRHRFTARRHGSRRQQRTVTGLDIPVETGRDRIPGGGARDDRRRVRWPARHHCGPVGSGADCTMGSGAGAQTAASTGGSGTASARGGAAGRGADGTAASIGAAATGLGGAGGALTTGGGGAAAEWRRGLRLRRRRCGHGAGAGAGGGAAGTALATGAGAAPPGCASA